MLTLQSKGILYLGIFSTTITFSWLAYEYYLERFVCASFSWVTSQEWSSTSRLRCACATQEVIVGLTVECFDLYFSIIESQTNVSSFTSSILGAATIVGWLLVRSELHSDDVELRGNVEGDLQ